jgi:low affinity Fe/Cu permease
MRHRDSGELIASLLQRLQPARAGATGKAIEVLLASPGDKETDPALQDTRRISCVRTRRFAPSRQRLGFVVAIAIIIIWASTGHFFSYSDTWQLLINTGTTIVTFLMVFIIQNTQNRDSKAVYLKLDELIRAVGSARNQLVNIDRLSDEELKKLEVEFKRLSKKADDAIGRVEDAAENVAEALEAVETPLR